MNDNDLAHTMQMALRLRDQMKADGASDAEVNAGLERTLRAAWPFTREWKFLCDRCDDTGLEMAQCPGDASCGREKPHLPHSFGVPCWCEKGRQFRPKPKADEGVEDAGKQVTRRPSRIGR